MANIKSAKKSIKKTESTTLNNQELKSRVNNLIKKLDKAILAKDKENANILLKDFQKQADKAVQKGLFKQNTMNRQKSRLNNHVKNINL